MYARCINEYTINIPTFGKVKKIDQIKFVKGNTYRFSKENELNCFKSGKNVLKFDIEEFNKYFEEKE